eukprot:7490270-Ditylum_brightwellii.AAC.1
MEEEKENEKNALLEKDHVGVESILSASDNVDGNESNEISNNDDDENVPVPKRSNFDPTATEEKSAVSSTADNIGYIASISHPDIIRAIWIHQTDHQNDEIFPH